MQVLHLTITKIGKALKAFGLLRKLQYFVPRSSLLTNLHILYKTTSEL